MVFSIGRFLNVLSCFPQLVSLFTFDSLGWCFQWAVYTSRTFQKVSRSDFRIRVGLFLPRFISYARSGVKFCLLLCPWGSCQNQDFWESAAMISLEYSAFFHINWCWKQLWNPFASETICSSPFWINGLGVH